MVQFSKKITVGKEERVFHFNHRRNVNGAKFFVTSHDDASKAISFSLTEKDGDWKLLPGSARWLYAIESDLATAIIDTRLN